VSLHRQTITLRNDLAEIPRLAGFVDAFCAPLVPTPADVLALQLALEEAVTNVINHGYADGQPHTFTVELAADDRRVTVVVTDDAPTYDPLARAEVDITLPLEDRPIGGLGVHLVKKLLDSARYERRDGRNILTLVRTLGPTA
jgi:anti-sigma regulatory factor (Ser/Thr protein kinase)